MSIFDLLYKATLQLLDSSQLGLFVWVCGCEIVVLFMNCFYRTSLTAFLYKDNKADRLVLCDWSWRLPADVLINLLLRTSPCISYSDSSLYLTQSRFCLNCIFILFRGASNEQVASAQVTQTAVHIFEHAWVFPRRQYQRLHSVIGSTWIIIL